MKDTPRRGSRRSRRATGGGPAGPWISSPRVTAERGVFHIVCTSFCHLPSRAPAVCPSRAAFSGATAAPLRLCSSGSGPPAPARLLRCSEDAAPALRRRALRRRRGRPRRRHLPAPAAGRGRRSRAVEHDGRSPVGEVPLLVPVPVGRGRGARSAQPDGPRRPGLLLVQVRAQTRAPPRRPFSPAPAAFAAATAARSGARRARATPSCS